jgi:hypothetical protein
MANQVQLTLTIPGEAAVVAMCDMIRVVAEGQTPEQKIELWKRYLELSQPWHNVALEVNKNIAAFVSKILGV